MLKYILFIGTLLALPSSNYAMTGEEAYNIAQGLGKKVQASHDHIQQLGLKGDSMIKAWQDLRELSGKSKASLDTGERARLTSAEKVLKPFFKENGKNGNNFFTLQKEIDQEIAQLDQYRREAKEARAYMESHPEEMKKYSNSEQLKERVQDNRDDIADAKMEALETSADLDRIESEYAQKEVSAYLADKLAQFMNSDSFCRAKNHCANPNTENPVDPALLYEEIFPEMKDTWKRKGDRETYNKVHYKSQPKNKAPAPIKPEAETPPPGTQNPK